MDRVNKLYYGFGSNLNGNLMSNNFLKTAVLKRNVYCKLIFTAKACSNKLGAAPVVRFSRSLVVDFPYICLQFFREIEVGRNQEKYLHTIALKINEF